MLNEYELRRGNYIYLKTGGKNILKIVTATHPMGLACNDGPKGKGLESARYDSGRIQAVHITSTWLYWCNGVVKQYPIAGSVYHLNQYIGLSANLVRDGSNHYEGFLLNFKIGLEMKTVIGVKPIVYVHQLQNVYFDLMQEHLIFNL